MYANVSDGTVVSIGLAPQTFYHNGRWWDLRQRDPEILAQAGWYLVNETTRPADTATHTHDATYTFDGTSVNQTWVQRQKTPGELASDTATINYNDLLSKIPAALANNQTAITNLQNAVQALTTISGQSFNNQTQRDNALKTNSGHSATIGQHAIALTRQNNALMRIIGNLLESQDGT